MDLGKEDIVGKEGRRNRRRGGRVTALWEDPKPEMGPTISVRSVRYGCDSIVH